MAQFQKGNNANPNGKGGFRDHPEHQRQALGSPNAWRKKFAGYTIEQLREELAKPDLTVVQLMVIQQYLDAVNQKTPVITRQTIRSDISDRIDGKPTQSIDASVENTTPTVKIEFADMSLKEGADDESNDQ